MSTQHVVELLGGSSIFGRHKNKSASLSLADAITEGFPQKSLWKIKDVTGLTDRQMATTLGISQKSISRYRASHRGLLDPVISDRLYRIASAYAHAREVFEDDVAAKEWMQAPQIGLGMRIPLNLLTTEIGAKEVERLLGRIDYGEPL